MTLNGAIMQLVEMRENSMMPEVFKPYFDKVIETVSECEEPSMIPERKKGKWGNHGECPFCSYLRQWEDDRFCGNCGADMRGEQE